jgi:cell division protein FtsB
VSSHTVEVHPTRSTSLRLSARAIVLLVIVCGVLTLAIAPLRGYLGQRGQLADLRRQAATLEQENAKLEARITQLYDPAYLERLARECLGMVKPGETAFVVVPAHGSPQPTDC